MLNIQYIIKIFVWWTRGFLCEDILRDKVFQRCSNQIQKHVEYQHISKYESDFQFGQELRNSQHLWKIWDNEFLSIEHYISVLEQFKGDVKECERCFHRIPFLILFYVAGYYSLVSGTSSDVLWFILVSVYYSVLANAQKSSCDLWHRYSPKFPCQLHGRRNSF